MKTLKNSYFRLDPGAGHLITFSQFVFIAIHGYIFTSKFGTVETHIPKRDYLILVLMFFLTSVVNNWAFNFNIPVPLHMIFRAVSTHPVSLFFRYLGHHLEFSICYILTYMSYYCPISYILTPIFFYS